MFELLFSNNRRHVLEKTSQTHPEIAAAMLSMTTNFTCCWRSEALICCKLRTYQIINNQLNCSEYHEMNKQDTRIQFRYLEKVHKRKVSSPCFTMADGFIYSHKVLSVLSKSYFQSYLSVDLESEFGRKTRILPAIYIAYRK